MILVVVRQDIANMGTRHDPHAPGVKGSRGKCQPGGDDSLAGEAPVLRVLMPRDETRALRFLDPEKCVPAKNIGPNQLLDRIENTRVTDQIIKPLKEHMRLATLCRRKFAATRSFRCLKLGSQGSGLRRIHDPNRRDIAFRVELFDLFRC